MDGQAPSLMAAFFFFLFILLNSVLMDITIHHFVMKHLFVEMNDADHFGVCLFGFFLPLCMDREILVNLD
jgi:hypothetical protein